MQLQRPSSESALIRVAVIDEESSTRESTIGVIETQPDLTVVGIGETGNEAVQLARDLHPEVLMLDLGLLDASGESVTRSIIESGNAHPALLLVAGGDDASDALSAIRAGASGICTREDPPEVMVHSVRRVAAGDVAVSPPVLGKMFEHLFPQKSTALDVCSGREVEVLGLVAEGATNSEIGERLYISETTVRSHVQSLRQKLGVRNRVDLVVLAHRAGLAEPVSPPSLSNGRSSNGNGHRLT